MELEATDSRGWGLGRAECFSEAMTWKRFLGPEPAPRALPTTPLSTPPPPALQHLLVEGGGRLRRGLATGSGGPRWPRGAGEWCEKGVSRFLLPSPPLRPAPGAWFVYLHSPQGSAWSHPCSWQPRPCGAGPSSSLPAPPVLGECCWAELETGLGRKSGPFSLCVPALSLQSPKWKALGTWFLLDIGAIYGRGCGEEEPSLAYSTSSTVLGAFAGVIKSS